MRVDFVTAQPGWFVAFYCEDNETEPASVGYDEIIMWKVETTSDNITLVEPITLDGSTSFTNIWGIKSPNGIITVQYIQSFETVEKFIEYAKIESKE